GVDRARLLEYWNTPHANQADRELLRQLVLAIRTWKPSVVITDHPDIKVTGSAADALVAEAVHAAMTQAAVPQAFPEQIEKLGLEPWAVQRVLALWDKKESHLTLDNDKELAHLGDTVREFV